MKQTVCSDNQEVERIQLNGYFKRPYRRTVEKPSHDYFKNDQQHERYNEPGKYFAGPFADTIHKAYKLFQLRCLQGKMEFLLISAQPSANGP